VVSATQMVVYVLKGHDRGAGAPSGPAGPVVVPQIAANKPGFSPCHISSRLGCLFDLFRASHEAFRQIPTQAFSNAIALYQDASDWHARAPRSDAPSLASNVTARCTLQLLWHSVGTLVTADT